jgi:hypothetical protein
VWKTKGQLKDGLIESLKRENAALRALLSKCGVVLDDSPIRAFSARRSTDKVTEKNVYRATRETRIQEDARRKRSDSNEVPATIVPNENSNV